MRARTDYLLRLRPWSLSAFAAALLAILVAAAMQEIAVSLGTSLYFAVFIPAILVASLLAGIPAGIFAVLVHSLFDFVLHTTAVSLLFLTLIALLVAASREYVDDADEPGERGSHRRSSATPVSSFSR